MLSKIPEGRDSLFAFAVEDHGTSLGLVKITVTKTAGLWE